MTFCLLEGYHSVKSKRSVNFSRLIWDLILTLIEDEYSHEQECALVLGQNLLMERKAF